MIYRPASYDDLAPAMQVIYQGVNDFVCRHGFEGLIDAVTPEFQAFSLEDDPDGLWVAEDSGRVIGLGFSWVCGRFWFLADLFILPQYQGRGVGGELMRRTLDHAKRHDASNRALITFAYNRVSIGLYLKHGLYPRQSLYTVAGAREAFLSRVSEALAWTTLDGSRSHLLALNHIDQASLGLSRAKHHRFLSREESVTGVLFKDHGSPVGYAYIWTGGHIGPLAVAVQSAMGPVFKSSLAIAAKQHTDQISAFLPGSNETAMSIALEHGMWLRRTMVPLSARAFGDWTKYMPNHPGFMRPTTTPDLIC